MTRKHFEAIAAEIAELRASYVYQREQATSPEMSSACTMMLCGIDASAERISRALAASNPRFSQTRFLDACGYNG